MTRFIHLLSGGAAQGLVNALKPLIEKTTDTQLSCTFGAVGLMKQKLLDAAPCDVIILTASLIEQLTSSGHVLAGSARQLGAVKTGVAVKHGTPWPQVDTAEQLKLKGQTPMPLAKPTLPMPLGNGQAVPMPLIKPLIKPLPAPIGGKHG